MKNNVYRPHELIQINNDYNIIDVSTESDNFFYIDNFYQNPDLMNRWILEHPKTFWKMHDELDTKNGIDYFDCRLSTKVFGYGDLKDNVSDIVSKIYKKEFQVTGSTMEFNIFKNINQNDNRFQHNPHVDNLEPGEKILLLFLDKVEDGGTMTYKGLPLPEFDNEAENLFTDVVNNYEFDTLLESKFNRGVLFDCDKLHGGYIEDYSKYIDEWRISQVFFLRPTPNQKSEKTLV